MSFCIRIRYDVLVDVSVFQLYLMIDGKEIDHSHDKNTKAEVKQLKQELTELPEEEAKADKLRSLPLKKCC